MRKIMLFAVAAVATLAIAACDSEDDGANVVEQPPAGATAPAGEQSDPDEPAGTLENPLATGVAFELTDWIVEFGGTNTDAGEEIAEGVGFEEPPAAGRQFVMAEVTVTYLGEEPSDPFIDLGFAFHGPDGTSYSDGEDDLCGLLPNDLFDVGEMTTDQSATANTCMAVPAEAIDGGAWSVEYLWDLDESDRVYVAVG